MFSFPDARKAHNQLRWIGRTRKMAGTSGNSVNGSYRVQFGCRSSAAARPLFPQALVPPASPATSPHPTPYHTTNLGAPSPPTRSRVAQPPSSRPPHLASLPPHRQTDRQTDRHTHTHTHTHTYFTPHDKPTSLATQVTLFSLTHAHAHTHAHTHTHLDDPSPLPSAGRPAPRLPGRCCPRLPRPPRRIPGRAAAAPPASSPSLRTTANRPYLQVQSRGFHTGDAASTFLTSMGLTSEAIFTLVTQRQHF